MSNKEMTTEKRLKVRLYLSLLVYTVVGYGLTLILDYIFSKFDNGIFAWLYWRLDLLFILYLMLGFICIFNYYWKKPWGYLDEVIDATQTVYEQNNHTVSLSEPLKELEEQLNQIKMSVLLSKQAAKQAEVVAVGPGGVVDGKEVKMEVKVGDQVIYSKYSGTEVKLDDEEYIIVKQSDILAIIQ